MQNDLAVLLEKGDYKAIIKLTKGQVDPDSLVALFIALAATGAEDEARELVTTHFEVMKARVGEIFSIHRDLLIKTDDRASGYRWLRRYEELPYASIVVEEAMKEFKAWLDSTPKHHDFNLAEWRRQIDSRDLDRIEAALHRLPTTKVRGELKRLTQLMSEEYPPRLRHQALLKLIAAQIDVPCPYGIEGTICEIVPSWLTLPEDNFQMQDFIKQMPRHGFDPSQRELGQELLRQYATAIFPMEPPYEDEEHLARGLRYLVGQYLHLAPIVVDEVSLTIAQEIEAALLRFAHR